MKTRTQIFSSNPVTKPYSSPIGLRVKCCTNKTKVKLHRTLFFLIFSLCNRNRNRNLKTSKALLKSQAHQGTSLFTSAATNQRGVSKGGSREAQVRIPDV